MKLVGMLCILMVVFLLIGCGAESRVNPTPEPPTIQYQLDPVVDSDSLGEADIDALHLDEFEI